MAVMSLGLSLYRSVHWRNDYVVREYATKREAEKILSDFNASALKQQMYVKFGHIPKEDQTRFFKEKGIKLPATNIKL